MKQVSSANRLFKLSKTGKSLESNVLLKDIRTYSRTQDIQNGPQTGHQVFKWFIIVPLTIAFLRCMRHKSTKQSAFSSSWHVIELQKQIFSNSLGHFSTLHTGTYPFTPKSDLIDFTLSNARGFYSSKGDWPWEWKGSTPIWICASDYNKHLDWPQRKH